MISENLQKVRERISSALVRAGRKDGEVELVAVTKTVSNERIREAVQAGQKVFGENYVQEAGEKIKLVGEGATWHFIGHLQTNKVKYMKGLFGLVHSVDSEKLASEMSRKLKAWGLEQDILIQVNVSGEESKSGVEPGGLSELAGRLMAMKELRIKGLMTMPPYFEDPERARPDFAKLRKLRDAVEAELKIKLPVLSMGMSGDFEAAIEEGSTMVRVGTAIFGERVYDEKK
jgi:pyridoxal phosphate enzyme (YggS family)